ncbi:hypothetical protein CDD80_4076 [Ophiocordyceps camponoti-rufipedis]|uniref:ATP synthase subunit 5, mitochondrial n=1 Tax=Ophiocordyceps camponoti-rufipedis TaxID=2004952 RepID=A0A2C5Z1L7_9HYPO|nr:hypothetical protein CDD80_4076 [Ophiocordyceps camponoti-rufipedis]
MATKARRTFAAAAGASSAETGRPPISLYGLDGTYATALYTAASKNSTLDNTARAMTSLSTTFSKDSRLTHVLSTPTLTAKDKASVVAELLKSMGGAGAGANDTVKNFLDALAANNRLGLLHGVCTKFADLMAAARGEVQMTVTSAQGKRLKVNNQVNADILGGLIVEIGDRTIDLSVSSRIAKMNKLLTDNL